MMAFPLVVQQHEELWLGTCMPISGLPRSQSSSFGRKIKVGPRKRKLEFQLLGLPSILGHPLPIRLSTNTHVG
ncbi:hypothetical protein C1H46_035040 [Malus baccata]|uniref:Uncharacterized protein n=1 Tax=Malus baccata TaxID=106549 RepID=A0A540KYW0_MALBA|nr:hypothetical protein C1H46_035040 [Malus baccata]